MKKLTLFSMMLFASAVINLVNAQCGPDVTYADWDAINPGISNEWGGTTTEVSAAPAGGTGNALLVHVGDGEWGYAGFTTSAIGGTIGLDCGTIITMDVFPDTVGELIIQLTSSYGSTWAIELSVNVPIAGGWNTINVDFSDPAVAYAWTVDGKQNDPMDLADIASGLYDQISLIPRAGETELSNWYIDDIVGPEITPIPCESCYIAALESIAVNGVALTEFYPFVYSYNYPMPAGSVTPTVTAVPNIAGQSVTVTIDRVFTPSSATIQCVSVDLIDTTEYIIWFVDYNRLPLDFEKGTYTMENFDGGILTYDTETELTGTYNNIGKLVKGAGATWAGGAIYLTTPIDSANNGLQFTMDVMSPNVGDTINLILENPTDNNNFVAASAISIVANAWETLIFDVVSDGTHGWMQNNISKVVVIPNINSQGTGEIYYIDNIYQVNCTVCCFSGDCCDDCINICPEDVDGNGFIGLPDLQRIFGGFGAVCNFNPVIH